jgi:molybdopterin/thiamine biosynthesis adenylyltransferase
MSEEMLTRQKLIEGINKDIKVLIVGAGGIGFHVAKLLAMSGVEEMYVFDPDIIEESNLNRLDITVDFIGKNKADVVRTVVKSLREDCNIKAMPFPIKEHTYPRGVDWVVDCTDKHKCQIEIEALAQKNGAKYCKIGYDGTRIAINDKVARWDTNEDEHEGYRTTPSWCVPAIVIAALGVGKILKYHTKEIGCDISELYR